jgi:hypothetical protein
MRWSALCDAPMTRTTPRATRASISDRERRKLNKRLVDKRRAKRVPKYEGKRRCSNKSAASRNQILLEILQKENVHGAAVIIDHVDCQTATSIRKHISDVVFTQRDGEVACQMEKHLEKHFGNTRVKVVHVHAHEMTRPSFKIKIDALDTMQSCAEFKRQNPIKIFEKRLNRGWYAENAIVMIVAFGGRKKGNSFVDNYEYANECFADNPHVDVIQTFRQNSGKTFVWYLRVNSTPPETEEGYESPSIEGDVDSACQTVIEKYAWREEPDTTITWGRPTSWCPKTYPHLTHLMAKMTTCPA